MRTVFHAVLPGHHADLACVDGFCAPLSAGYVQLGFVTWVIKQGLQVQGGLGVCQAACGKRSDTWLDRVCVCVYLCVCVCEWGGSDRLGSVQEKSHQRAN